MNAPNLAGIPMDRFFHVCALFSGRDEEYGVLAPFFKEGITWGEKVVNIIDGRLKDEHCARLTRAGIDVPSCQSCGQLDLLTWEQAYLSGGVFEPDRMLKAVDQVLADGAKAGYPRVRLMGNMAWVLEGAPGSERLIEYECRANEILARTRQPAICVYDVNRLTGGMMMDVLRVHPLTLVGGVLHENPFYVQPEQMLAELRSRKATGRVNEVRASA
jgi:hypothetical protein